MVPISRVTRILVAGASTSVIAAFLCSPAHAGQAAQSPAQQTAAPADIQPPVNGDVSPTVNPEAAQSSSATTDIVVTGRRAAIENATVRKRNSDTVIDSIVADEAGKLPDTSLTEVLQRVTGVTISRFGSLGSPDQFSFEGTGIQVRGLSGVTGLLNGREIFSANGGSGLNWGDVTPELMAAVDVYKASTADLIEGGIGGAIDLRTRMPFDYKKATVDATVGGSYGDFAKKLTPSASVLLTDSWHTPLGEFGALLDLSYSRFKYADSFVRAEPYFQTTYQGQQVFVPGGFDYGNDGFDRKRRGLYAAFQLRPSDTLTLYQIDFVSNYKQTNTGGNVFVVNDVSNPVVSGKFDSQNVFQSGVVAAPNGGSFFPGNDNGQRPSDTTTADFTQGFTWTPSSRFSLRGALQFVHSVANSDGYGFGIGSGGIPQVQMDFTGDLPKVGFNGTGGNVLDPTQATVNNIVWNHTRNRANMTAENLDAEFNIDGGFFKKLKAGARYANRRETDNFTGTYWSAVGRGWNGVPQSTVASSPASDFITYTFPDFFKGELPVPGSYLMVNPAILKNSLLQRNLTQYASCSPAGPVQCADPTQSVSLYADDSFGNQPVATTTKTTTLAGYIELTFGSQNKTLPFSGNVGVRVVHNTVHSLGQFSINAGQQFFATQADEQAAYIASGGVQSPNLPGLYTLNAYQAMRNESNEYTRVLPSINLNFKPSETWIVRVAVNQTISPAGYNDIRASGSTTVKTVQTYQNFPGVLQSYSYGTGNPKLKPAVSTNEDLSIEWYPKPSTTAHIDVFNKSIKDLLIYNAINLPFAEFFNNLSPTATQNGVTVPIPSGAIAGNGSFNATARSRIRGVEVGLRTYFDMLPGVLRGLGIDVNFTYIDSKSPSNFALDMQGNQLKNLPIVGLSKYNYNVQLLYDLGKIDARLAYSWRSKYLATTAGNGTQGTYQINGAGPTIQYALPVFADATGQLDASFSYKFNKNFSLSIDGSNLLNNVTTTSMEILPGIYKTRSWFMNDRRVAATAHLHFG